MSSTGNGSSSLSAAARVERDRRIAEARDHEGLTWPEIGARFGMDERSADRRCPMSGGRRTHAFVTQ